MLNRVLPFQTKKRLAGFIQAGLDGTTIENGVSNRPPRSIMNKTDFIFETIDKHIATDMVITHHYAHRKCPISWAWGIRTQGRHVGVLTIGKPVSWSVMCSLVGETPEEMKTNPIARSRDVYELNRLWVSDECPKNLESRFIGWCLRELKKLRPNLILVSYADGSKKHVGKVYQATNWVYTGQSLPFMDICVEGFGDYRSVPQELRGGYVYVCKTHGKFPTPYSNQPSPVTLPCPEPECLDGPARRLSTRAWAILEYVIDAAGTPHKVTRVSRSIKHRYVMPLNSADKKFLIGDWAAQPYPQVPAEEKSLT
jgi:hypothetical protein